MLWTHSYNQRRMVVIFAGFQRRASGGDPGRKLGALSLMVGLHTQ
jgi:hypothetical protein